MAERAQQGSLDMDSALVGAEVRSSDHGRVLAFILALTAMVAAIVFFAVGNVWAGALLLSMPVVMLVRSMFGWPSTDSP